LTGTVTEFNALYYHALREAARLGRVPTPYGPIKVKWKKTSQGLRLEIEVPNGTTGSVGLPTFSNALTIGM
jgi:hypothetical protein